MTYSIIRTVYVDCGDHNYSYLMTIKSGIKTVKQAERRLLKMANSKKFVKRVKKEFEDRHVHATELKEFFTVVDENDDQASESYWERKVWKNTETLSED